MSKNRLVLPIKPKQKSKENKQASEYMRYSRGDIVRFRIGSDEIQEGEIQVIEEDHNEDILYINSFSDRHGDRRRWAYKVPERSIVSRVPGY